MARRSETVRLLATTASAILIASQAYAGSYEVRCETTTVPYQETVKGGEPDKVIGGALIGGVIGKAVTDENAGAAVGAIIGGAVGHESSRTTVTRYKDVETCQNVFIPERVTDGETLGVAYDGKWGPKSQLAAEKYLANLEPDAPLYSLVVNDVVIVSSPDVSAIDAIKEALLEAGVASQIFVDLQ